PFYPAIYKGWVYFASPYRLQGMALDGTLLSFSKIPGYLSRVEEKNSEIFYAPTVEGDKVYCSFIVNPQFINSENFRGIPIKEPIPLRRLMCFNRFTGAKIWEKDGKDDPFFKSASFPFPPIVKDNQLFGMVYRIKGYVQTFLVALDADTGKTLWKKWISSGSTETTMFGYHAREPLSTMVTEQDGILYCATEQGVIAALRAIDGRMLWAYRYDTLRIRPAKYYQPVIRKIEWANTPPLVWGNRICVTPLDSNYFYVLDTKTGRLVWKKSRILSYRGSLKYLVGISQGLVILSNKSAVAYDIESGKLVWKTQFIGCQPLGRGIIAGKKVYFPVLEEPSRWNDYKKSYKIIEVDLNVGIQNSHILLPLGVQAGNLVVTKDYVFLGTEKNILIFKNRP
ncbi:MAG: hypothetical protein D6785_06825, partial [Planctomycetota bacterium]